VLLVPLIDLTYIVIVLLTSIGDAQASIPSQESFSGILVSKILSKVGRDKTFKHVKRHGQACCCRFSRLVLQDS
jgi:hypothetical protein